MNVENTHLCVVWGGTQIAPSSMHTNSVAMACINLFLKVGISTVCSPFSESPNLHLVPISPIRAGFQREHISSSWPRCLPADIYPLISDLKTDIEGMLMKLLNQLRLMFSSTYHTTIRVSAPRGLQTPVLHMYCSTPCTDVLRTSCHKASLKILPKCPRCFSGSRQTDCMMAFSSDITAAVFRHLLYRTFKKME